MYKDDRGVNVWYFGEVYSWELPVFLSGKSESHLGFVASKLYWELVLFVPDWSITSFLRKINKKLEKYANRIISI